MTFKIYDEHISDEIRTNLIHSQEYQSLQHEDYRFWKMSDFNHPSNTIEKTLHAIWKDMIDPYEYAKGGIEYWVPKSRGETAGKWHIDLVEKEQHKGYEPGDKTIVYYPWVQCDGGFLELMTNQNSPSMSEIYEMLRKLAPN